MNLAGTRHSLSEYTFRVVKNIANKQMHAQKIASDSNTEKLLLRGIQWILLPIEQIITTRK